MEYIEQTRCKKCNISKSEVLCFHHRDPATKLFDIHWGFTHNYSLNRLKSEAKKCDVLCANCHTILHHLGERCKHTEHAKRANQNLSIKCMLMQKINQTKCLQCGFDKPEALAFHHRLDKKFTISEAIGILSIYDLLSEVIKCDILCMNCHLLKHSI